LMEEQTGALRAVPGRASMSGYESGQRASGGGGKFETGPTSRGVGDGDNDRADGMIASKSMQRTASNGRRAPGFERRAVGRARYASQWRSAARRAPWHGGSRSSGRLAMGRYPTPQRRAICEAEVRPFYALEVLEWREAARTKRDARVGQPVKHIVQTWAGSALLTRRRKLVHMLYRSSACEDADVQSQSRCASQSRAEVSK
jgi:hypothetical protein